MEELLQYKAWVVGGWLALILAWEWLHPAVLRPAVEKWTRIGRNIGLWVLNTGLSPLIVLPLSLWASQHNLGWRPGWWQGPGGLLADLLLLDFLIYWWHRANHVIPFFWRFHEVHHLDRFLDATSAIRFHFGEVLLSALFRSGVIILFAIPFKSVVIFEVLVLLSAIFHHSNLRLPVKLEKALSYVIVTPSIHWMHHHAVRMDTDSNYSTILSVWDRLFSSRSQHHRMADMPIGVDAGKGKVMSDESIGRLLIKPFRKRQY